VNLISSSQSVGKNIAEQDAHVIEILRAAGAVFYCKTTLPQAIMHLETNSYLGPTTNPYNRSTMSAGGSSGGEGALIAIKGSVLGIGTDIGGSIRSVCRITASQAEILLLVLLLYFDSLPQQMESTVSNQQRVSYP
jgi:hypothetical protein